MGNVDAACRCESCKDGDDMNIEVPSQHVVPVLEPFSTAGGLSRIVEVTNRQENDMKSNSDVTSNVSVKQAPKPKQVARTQSKEIPEDDMKSTSDVTSNASAKQAPKPKKAARTQSKEKQEEERRKAQEQEKLKAAEEEAAMALVRKKAHEEEERQVNLERLRRLGPLGRDGAKLQVQLETGWADCSRGELKQVCDHVGGGDTKFPIQARGAVYIIDWSNPAAITQTNMTSQKKRNMRVV